jgi:hypothetical protein
MPSLSPRNGSRGIGLADVERSKAIAIEVRGRGPRREGARHPAVEVILIAPAAVNAISLSR